MWWYRHSYACNLSTETCSVKVLLRWVDPEVIFGHCKSYYRCVGLHTFTIEFTFNHPHGVCVGGCSSTIKTTNLRCVLSSFSSFLVVVQPSLLKLTSFFLPSPFTSRAFPVLIAIDTLHRTETVPRS